jgi:hypothetical protein
MQFAFGSAKDGWVGHKFCWWCSVHEFTNLLKKWTYFVPCMVLGFRVVVIQSEERKREVVDGVRIVSGK